MEGAEKQYPNGHEPEHGLRARVPPCLLKILRLLNAGIEGVKGIKLHDNLS